MTIRVIPIRFGKSWIGIADELQSAWEGRRRELIRRHIRV